ncbi:MAG: hypothetical protein KJ077_12165 [Anaerolineae bacterium]|nr:hypothetical protein [Anaerolineae bacterium]
MSLFWTLLSRFQRRLCHLPPASAVAGLFGRIQIKGKPGFFVRPAVPDLSLGWPALAVVAVSPTLSPLRKINRVFFILLFLALILGSWLRPAPATQAQTMDQAETPFGLTLAIAGPSTVNVGETFEIQVVFNNPSPAGVFGYQFGLTWNSAVVIPVEPAPTLSPEFPLVAQNEVANGQLAVAASRQGDVPDLPGSLTLLTWRFQAVAPTGVDSTRFELIAPTLGQKDGTGLPLEAVTPLAMGVAEPAPQRGSLLGNVQVEGRAPGSQANINILINESGLALAAAPGGEFTFADLDFGAYTLTASSPGFLRATCNVIHQSELTTLAGLTLLAGDLNDDGAIDVADATALGLAISSSAPGAVADLNVDGTVNVLDLIPLAVNFGQSAAAHPWLCQP